MYVPVYTTQPFVVAFYVQHKMHISFLNPSCNRCYLLFDLKVDLFSLLQHSWMADLVYPAICTFLTLAVSISMLLL